MRPGAAPPPRRVHRPLGPTPRYSVVPRWGLQDHFEAPAPVPVVEPTGSSARFVRYTLLTTLVLLGIAVVAHIARYALLLINRSVLLNPIVAGIGTWTGVVASVLAFFALAASAVVLTNWLVARRAAAYAVHGVPDPRPTWVLWVGCLVPLFNLFWAPVFVLELARVEGRLTWVRSTIVTWWCVWWVSAALTVFANATSFTTDAQGIANNTVATTIAYLAALAALALTIKVYRGFEDHAAVDRPVRRWVVVPDDSAGDSGEPRAEIETESTVPVESKRDEPAA